MTRKPASTRSCGGDDLLSSAPRQAYLATLLGFAVPTYAHVPLVVNAAGVRLSKRDGAVTLEDLAVQGVSTQYVVNAMARSLGLAVEGEHATAAAMLTHFDPAALPRSLGCSALKPADCWPPKGGSPFWPNSCQTSRALTACRARTAVCASTPSRSADVRAGPRQRHPSIVSSWSRWSIVACSWLRTEFMPMLIRLTMM